MERALNSQKALKIAGITLILLSSCGNLGPAGRSQELSLTSTSSAGITSFSDSNHATDSDAGFDCPIHNNIVPDYDYALDGTGFYKVCKNRDIAVKIRVHGTAPASGKICVFPVEFAANGQPRTLSDPKNNGLAKVDCADVNQTKSGLDFTFELYKFNGVIIVDQNDVFQMSACAPPLGRGTPDATQCPKNFSLGQF